MIAGLGTDLVEVDRMQEVLKRQVEMSELIFSPREIAYCETQTNKFENYAARFAAKEAFFKSLGTGWLSGTAFNEVEIINNADGKPEIVLSGNTADVIVPMGFTNITVSLTHVKTMASATVIIEK